MSVTFHPNTPTFEPEMNVSNRNAIWILNGLGIEVDYEYGIVGSIPADELLQAIAKADIPDNGVATITSNGGRFIDCGVEEGYFKARLNELWDIAMVAEANGTEVTFA